MITTYLAMDSGRITISDIDVRDDPLGVRQKIGYLPESAPLYLDMEVLEYLRFVAAIRNIPRSLRRDRIKEIVEACGLGGMLKRKVGYLSKGYRQRVGLAQSMIHDPNILILDEPTSGLDPNQIIEIRDLIKRIGREKTVILSTHILSEVQSTCSRVLIIDNGRIVADGDPDQLAGSIEGGGVVYKVAIKGDRGEVESALGSAPFITSFKFAGDSEGALLFDLRGQDKAEIGEKIFRLAVEKNFVLRELHREVASLESVFASLTVGDV
jgi:ABC-2 type transport system ATP-binding protein